MCACVHSYTRVAQLGRGMVGAGHNIATRGKGTGSDARDRAAFFAQLPTTACAPAASCTVAVLGRCRNASARRRPSALLGGQMGMSMP